MQELPPGLDLLWGERPPRGRRGGLSVDRIVETAIALADADGLEGVSMARVAERLGFTPMALYRHVSNKDELLVLMQDAAVGPPPPWDDSLGGWRPQLERWTTDLLAIYNRHPWWIHVPISPPPPTPSQMAWLERGLRALADTPLGEADKAAIMLMLSGLVSWEARLAAEITPGPQRVYAEVARALVDDERFPALGRAAASGIFEDESREIDFVFSLRVALDGVESLIAQASK
jgi:AcrR family transcriptional regulator